MNRFVEKIYLKLSLLDIFLFSWIFLIGLPASALTVAFRHSLTVSILTFIHQAIVLVGVLIVILILNRSSRLKKLLPIAAVIFSAYYTIVYIIIGYWLYASEWIDIVIVFDFYRDLLRISAEMIAVVGVILTLVVMFIIWMIFFIFFFSAAKGLKKAFLAKLDLNIFSKRYILLALLLITTIDLLTPNTSGYVGYQYTQALNVIKARINLPIAYSFQLNENEVIQSSEDVFILQLESGNAIALNGLAYGYQKKAYKNNNYMPNLYLIAKNGVLFPFMWSNSIQTNRAQLNMLCGIIGNIGRALSYTPEKISIDCLPKIFARSGYNTLFFGSNDGKIGNTKEFMESIGFNKVLYKDIMRPEDPKYSWGYDDCIFYKRVFEYLEKNKLFGRKPLFVYIEVSMHHFPWNLREKYNAVHKFGPPTNFLERYLDSNLEQDYCLSTFYENFKKYSKKNSHLFITYDHSWPLGEHNNLWNDREAYNENFLIPFAYIPAASRKEEFAIGAQIVEKFSLGDFAPTLLEILSKKHYPNSFAYALKQNNISIQNNNCHILVQPYGGAKVAVVNNNYKYIYSVQDKNITIYNLVNDFYEKNPLQIINKVPIKEFVEQYYCKRYKYGHPNK